MKTFTALATVAVAALAVAAAPSASFATVTHYYFHLTTAKGYGTFTASGTSLLSSAATGGQSLPCTTHYTGVVGANGTLHLKTASYSDYPGTTVPGLCGAITPTGLPWATTATSLTAATINGAHVTGPNGISCGPGPVPVTVSGSTIIYSGDTLNPGNCGISGQTTTTPAISITTTK